MLKKSIWFTLKIVVLTIWMSVLFIVGSATLGPVTPAAANRGDGSELTLVLAVSLVDTLLLAVFILRSRLYGWRLMAATAVLFYGVKTFMSVIEAWYFIKNVTPEMLPGLFTMFVPITLLYPPLAVIVWGRLTAPAEQDSTTNDRVIMPAWQLIAKLAVLSIIVYPVLLFGFGYYVAWQNPAVVAFYQGVDEGSFIAHMSALLKADSFVYPFEIMRGLLWVGLALIVIRWMRGRVWEAGLLVALMFALLQNDVHLYPNPLMPRAVSTTHFIETASSNFIWAWAITWLMGRAHRSLSDLFGLHPKAEEVKRTAHA